MKKHILIFLIFISLFFSGCFTTKNFHYDRQYDFNYVKSFTWKTVSKNESTDQFTADLIKAEISNILKNKGLVENDQSYDCIINLNIKAVIKNKVSEIHSEQLAEKKRKEFQMEELTIEVAITNPETKLKLWWGSTKIKMSMNISLDNKENTVKENLADFFKNFPPPLN